MINLISILVRAYGSVLRPESPQRALKRLQASASPSIKQLLEQDGLGNTVLHHAARGRLDNLKFDEVINTVEEEAGIVMAKIVNIRGEIPAQVAGERLHRGNPIRAKIIALTRKHQSRPLHALTDLNEVMAPYKDKNISKTLHENLVLGCTIVNMVRDLKLESLTHPHVNDLPQAEQTKLFDKIEFMRNEARQKGQLLLKEMVNESKDTKRLAYFDQQKSIAIKHGVGNCAEFSMIAMFYLLTYGAKTDILSLILKKADHEMVLIGNLNDENAVVCDSHAGQVYPFREFNDHATGSMFKLSFDFARSRGIDWMTQTSYEPRVHRFEGIPYPYI